MKREKECEITDRKRRKKRVRRIELEREWVCSERNGG